MKNLESILSCILVLAAIGCTSTFSEKNITNEPPPVLRSTSRIYVVIPFDASFKGEVAIGSGKATAQSLFAAFSKYIRGTFISRAPESLSDSLGSARQMGAEYLVYPNIVRWEDRSTEWNGMRDQLEMKVDLIDLSTSKVVFSREITATGKWMTDGGDTPIDLIEKPVEQYVNTLFRRIERPTAL